MMDEQKNTAQQFAEWSAPFLGMQNPAEATTEAAEPTPPPAYPELPNPGELPAVPVQQSIDEQFSEWAGPLLGF